MGGAEDWHTRAQENREKTAKHKPVLAGSLCQPVLACPGLVHDARIARHWLLPEATPASQVTLHDTIHNYLRC